MTMYSSPEPWMEPTMTTASPAVFWYSPLKDTFDYKNIHSDTLITNTLSLKKTRTNWLDNNYA